MNKPICVIQGYDKTFYIKVIDPKTKQPVDLTQASQILFTYRKSDQTLGTIDTTSGLTVIPSPETKLQVDLTPTISNTMEIAKEQDFKLTFVLNNKTYLLLFEKKLNVELDPLAS